MSAGTNYTTAIRSDSALFTWGLDDQGQLGFNDRVHRSSPVQVGTSSWTSVGAGGNYTTAIRSDSALFTWGYNHFGQLGSNTIVSCSSPVQIPSYNISNNYTSPTQVGSASAWTNISAGQNYSLGTNNNVLYGWGGSATALDYAPFLPSPAVITGPTSPIVTTVSESHAGVVSKS